MRYIGGNADNKYVIKASEVILNQVMEGPTRAAQAFDQFGKATREAAVGARATTRQAEEYRLKGEQQKAEAASEMDITQTEQAGMTKRARMRYGDVGTSGGLTPKDMRAERGKLFKNAEDYAVGLTPDDFAGLRERFPKYADLSDNELREAELQRYYRQRIQTENLYLPGERDDWDVEESSGAAPWAEQTAEQAEQVSGTRPEPGQRGGRLGSMWRTAKRQFDPSPNLRAQAPPDDPGPNPVVQEAMSWLSGHTDEDLLKAHKSPKAMDPEQREAVARELERRGITPEKAGRTF
jgi:hypothetical protein